MSQCEERSQSPHQKIDVLPMDGEVHWPITENATIAEFMKLQNRIRRMANVWLGRGTDWSAPPATDIEAQIPSSSEEETNANEIAVLRGELRQVKQVIDNHIARDKYGCSR